MDAAVERSEFERLLAHAERVQANERVHDLVGEYLANNLFEELGNTGFDILERVLRHERDYEVRLILCKLQGEMYSGCY